MVNGCPLARPAEPWAPLSGTFLQQKVIEFPVAAGEDGEIQRAAKPGAAAPMPRDTAQEATAGRVLFLLLPGPATGLRSPGHGAALSGAGHCFPQPLTALDWACGASVRHRLNLTRTPSVHATHVHFSRLRPAIYHGK